MGSTLNIKGENRLHSVPQFGKKESDSHFLPALAHRKSQRTYEDTFYEITFGAANFKVR